MTTPLSLRDLSWTDLYNVRDRYPYGSLLHDMACDEIARREEEERR